MILKGAMQGTPCARGHICLFGICTKNSYVPTRECYNNQDDFVIQSDVDELQLPKNIMSCESFTNFLEIKNLYPGDFCKDLILEKCCNSCLSKYFIL